MSLTRKTALTLIFTFAVVMLIQTLVSRLFLLKQFESLEQEQTLRTLQLLVDRIRVDRDHLRTQATDWAEWDEMYDYLVRPSPEFEQSNFTVATNEYTNTDFLIAFDNDLKTYHQQWFDREQRQLIAIPSDLIHTIQQAIAQVNLQRPNATLLHFNDAFYLVGAAPILTSAQEGPAHGVFVMGRRLSTDIAASLLAKTDANLNFTYVPVGDNDSANRLEFDSIHFHAQGDRIASEATMGDWFDKPLLRVSLNTSRAIYQQGVLAQRYGLLSIMLAAGLTLTVLFFSLRHLVLKRLIITRDTLREITNNGEDAARLIENKDDEIGEVNHSINLMLNALSRNKDIERRNNLIVRERLETLTQLTWSVAMQAEHDDIIWPDILTACSRHFSDSYSSVYVLDDNRVQLRLQHANHHGWQSTVSCNTAPAKWDDIFNGKRRTVLFNAEQWPQFAGTQGQLLLAALTKKKEFVGVLVLMHKTKSWRDADGDFIASLARIASQAMARQADSLTTQALRQQAQTDTLTGLANRTALFEHLDYVLNRVRIKNQINAVLFIDLDGFKAINDQLGHGSGDRVLIQLGFRLQKLMRANDMVARFGGDEFVVVLDQIEDVNVATRVADKIMEKINEPVQLPEQNVQLGCSIGIALYPEHALNLERLMEHADQAMYIAKKSGKNKVVVFQHGERAN